MCVLNWLWLFIFLVKLHCEWFVLCLGIQKILTHVNSFKQKIFLLFMTVSHVHCTNNIEMCKVKSESHQEYRPSKTNFIDFFVYILLYFYAYMNLYIHFFFTKWDTIYYIIYYIQHSFPYSIWWLSFHGNI